jgi:hypothetical protein
MNDHKTLARYVTARVSLRTAVAAAKNSDTIASMSALRQAIQEEQIALAAIAEWVEARAVQELMSADANSTDRTALAG